MPHVMNEGEYGFGSIVRFGGRSQLEGRHTDGETKDNETKNEECRLLPMENNEVVEER